MRSRRRLINISMWALKLGHTLLSYHPISRDNNNNNSRGYHTFPLRNNNRFSISTSFYGYLTDPCLPYPLILYAFIPGLLFSFFFFFSLFFPLLFYLVCSIGSYIGFRIAEIFGTWTVEITILTTGSKITDLSYNSLTTLLISATSDLISVKSGVCSPLNYWFFLDSKASSLLCTSLSWL